MISLNLDRPITPTGGVFTQLKNIYAGMAASDDYERNNANLRLIQICVMTVSAVATGVVNAFAHRDRLGWVGASLLALAITGFVERFYFTLRHGLTTTYNSGKQRSAAYICYRTIQITMVLNAAVLCVWIVGLELPRWLSFWYRWSIAVHFALALIGVAAVRDADAVTANHMLELRAVTAEQDLTTVRRAAAIGNPMVLIAAKMRGYLDAFKMAVEIIRGKSTSSNSGKQLQPVDQPATTLSEPSQ